MNFTFFNCFTADLAKKVHKLDTDQLVVALTNAANPPNEATHVKLADLTVIPYTHLSSRNLTTSSFTSSGAATILKLADLVLSASGGSVAPFRYIVIYNDTAATDPLIGWYDYGADLTLNSGDSLTLDFDASLGWLVIS